MADELLERRYYVARIRKVRRQPPGTLHGDSETPAVVSEEHDPVEDFCFVLRPERDPHARVALRAYAEAEGDTALGRGLRRWLEELGDA